MRPHNPVQVIPVAKAIIFLIPIAVFLWAFARYFSLSGTLTVHYDFRGESPMVSEFYPRGRALDREQNLRTAEVYQRIVGEPVYMDVDVPRSFDTVDVTMEYFNPDQSILEFGLVTSREPWAVALQPLENRVIDEALLTWNRTETNDGIVLLQREPLYSSVEEFLASPPEHHIATYQYVLAIDYHDPAYSAEDGGITIDRQLRGPHDFVTYIKDETLHIEFDIVDMNREFNVDDVRVAVYQGDTPVFDQLLPDDGITEATSVLSSRQTIIVDVPNLPEGAYRIDMTTTNDIVIEQIRSDQHKLVVVNHLYIMNNEEYRSVFPETATSPTALQFSGRKLTLQTDHPNGLQTVVIGEATVPIETVHSPHVWLSENTDWSVVETITLPVNDLILDAKGFFAFASDQFFDPNKNTEYINERTEIDELGSILYRNYTSPQTARTISTQSRTLTLDGVSGDRKHLTFVLSAPGLDRERFLLAVRDIQFVFTREPLVNRLRKRFFQ